jgi:hypothetical protein
MKHLRIAWFALVTQYYVYLIDKAEKRGEGDGYETILDAEIERSRLRDN